MPGWPTAAPRPRRRESRRTGWWSIPGIGFGKTLEHNLALLRGLDRVAGGRPLLVGASRKSFIGLLGGAPVAERLPGSLAALVAARRGGASLVRVHDVAASIQFLDVLAGLD